MAPSFTNIVTLVVSLILIIVTGIDYYMVLRGMKIMNYYFPKGNYVWWTFDGYLNSPRESGHNILLDYSTETETQILIATSLTIAAGLAGVVGYFVVNRATKSFTHLLTNATLLTTAFASFLSTFIIIIVTSVKHDQLGASTCITAKGNIPDHSFYCTRELIACRLLQTPLGGITETNWADNKRACRETKAARLLLVPCVLLSAALVGLYTLRSGKGWKEKVSADERVERLQRE